MARLRKHYIIVRERGLARVAPCEGTCNYVGYEDSGEGAEGRLRLRHCRHTAGMVGQTPRQLLTSHDEDATRPRRLPHRKYVRDVNTPSEVNNKSLIISM